MSANESFKDRLIIELNFHGISNKEFASLVGISINTLNMYLYRGSIPAADLAVKMAKVLNTTVEYLITGEGNKEKNQSELNRQKKELLNIIESFSEKQIQSLLTITKAFKSALDANI